MTMLSGAGPKQVKHSSPEHHFHHQKNGLYHNYTIYSIFDIDQSLLRNLCFLLTTIFLMETPCFSPLPNENLILYMKTFFIHIFEYI